MKQLVVAACLALPCVQAAPAAGRQALELNGAVSYTQVYRFDYDKDGQLDRVRFCLELKARPAAGAEGEAGYRAEEGHIRYYVFDVDKNVRVEKWLEGFAMLNQDAVAAYHPATNIAISGNVATFEAFGMKWTVVDGGPGYQSDRITVDDGFRKKDLKLYSGDVTIGPVAASTPVR